MANIFGYELDIISFVPALFGAGLSLYNWLQMRKPAQLKLSPLIRYGLIYSELHQGTKLILPIIVHNDGSQRGIITGVKFGFRAGEKVINIPLIGQVKLKEVSEDIMIQGGWNDYRDTGFKFIMPIYPIEIEPYESKHVVMVANAWHTDGLFPVGIETTCVIELEYGDNKTSKTEFPFHLKAEDVLYNDVIGWYEPISRHPEADDPEFEKDEFDPSEYDQETLDTIKKIYG